MDKVSYFNSEYNYIKDDKIRNDLKYLVSNLPDYFFEMEASSTGKYHPKFASSEHGLVKHTKVAVRIAYELMSNPALNNFTSREKDLMIMALTLHDGLKCGNPKEKYMRFDHPLLVSNFIKDNKNKLSLSDEDIEFVTSVISSHMGNWNTDYNGNEVLPKPKTKYENFVHMCDYLASRKYLNIKFDSDDNIIE